MNKIDIVMIGGHYTEFIRKLTDNYAFTPKGVSLRIIKREYQMLKFWCIAPDFTDFNIYNKLLSKADIIFFGFDLDNVMIYYYLEMFQRSISNYVIQVFMLKDTDVNSEYVLSKVSLFYKKYNVILEKFDENDKNSCLTLLNTSLKLYAQNTAIQHEKLFNKLFIM